MDSVTDVALDARGAAIVTGVADGSGLPTTTGALQQTNHGGQEAFVSRLSANGTVLEYSTWLGGSSSDSGLGIALDALGAATVVGQTVSADFPTTPGTFASSFSYNPLAFISRLDLLPTGVTAFGSSSAGCAGPLSMTVLSAPRVGNAGFSLSCGHAPPTATGTLLLAASGLTTPWTVAGIAVWIDPASAFFVALPLSSDASGVANAPMPIPLQFGLVGASLATQMVWSGATAPAPCPTLGLSATHALAITVQP